MSRIAYFNLLDFLEKRNCKGRKCYGDDINWERNLLGANTSDTYDLAETIGNLMTYSTSLTDKRRRIFVLLAQGFSNKEIAEKCDMSHLLDRHGIHFRFRTACAVYGKTECKYTADSEHD